MPTPGPFTPTLPSQALTASLTPWAPHTSQQSHEPTGRLTEPSTALAYPLPSLPSPTRARCEPDRASGVLDILLTGLLVSSGAHCRCSRENHAKDAHRDPRRSRRQPRGAQQASCGGASGASKAPFRLPARERTTPCVDGSEDPRTGSGGNGVPSRDHGAHRTHQRASEPLTFP